MCPTARSSLSLTPSASTVRNRSGISSSSTEQLRLSAPRCFVCACDDFDHVSGMRDLAIRVSLSGRDLLSERHEHIAVNVPFGELNPVAITHAVVSHGPASFDRLPGRENDDPALGP